MTTGNTTEITTTSGGVLPTVPSGGIAYTTASEHLPLMHKIVQDAIEAWQSSNSSKFEIFTVGRNPRDMRAQEVASNSNFNYINFYFRAITSDNLNVYQPNSGYGFGSVPDNTLIQTMRNNASNHAKYLGFDMYKNLNVNGASVPYGLFSHGADPLAAYQGNNDTYMYQYMYRHNSISAGTVLFDMDNQTRNGYR